MPKYLTQEWLDRQRELAQDFPERPGATARMQYVVKDTPDGDVPYSSTVEDGRLVDAQLGQHPDADFTLTMGYDDSLKIAKSELDENAAFMQGKLKVVGNMGKLMALMPLTQSAEYKGAKSALAEETEF